VLPYGHLWACDRFRSAALDRFTAQVSHSPTDSQFLTRQRALCIEQAKAPFVNRIGGHLEGYMDVLMTHQYSRKNVIASMGTALTEKQSR